MTIKINCNFLLFNSQENSMFILIEQVSRSPSLEDERENNSEPNLHELQSQILARNAERPTVVNGVNIKIE